MRLAAGVSGQAEAARDIAQDVFVAVFQGLSAFRGGSSLRTWIYRITLRIALRHAVRSKRHSPSGLGPDFDQRQGNDAADTDATLAELAGALGRLPLEARTVLSLVAIEGLSHEEAAAVLGVPVGTVGSRLHHARRKLIAAMAISA